MWQNKITKSISVLLALFLWHILSILVDSDILLVSPIEVVYTLPDFLLKEGIWSIIGFSFLRITVGLLMGTVLGVMLALVSSKFQIIEILIWPYMVTVKSVPVASFVVIALLWISGANLSIFISFLMVLPVVYLNLLDGIKSIDKQMLEMANLFKMTFFRRLKYIILPSLKPFLLSAVKLSVGLAWKSGVAAELIGYPDGSVGEALYYSKLYLETRELFQWTLIVVLLSVATEKLILLALKRAVRGEEAL